MEGQDLGEFPFFPFCSKRCKLIDLGRWLDGTNAIGLSDEETADPRETEVP
jgi:endogenous inhibitor of DNA gyrase (YacG/DUF329 family)